MKNPRSFYLIAFLTILTCTHVKAQLNYQAGHAVLTNGTTVSGQIGYFESDPWYNQRYILLKDSAELGSNPNAKPKRYKADDLVSYQVGTHQYQKVHFVDAENLQLKSLGSNQHMMEILANGRINAYKFYSYPADFDGTYGTEAEIKNWEKQKKNDLMTGYKILISKDKESKVKNAFDLDLLKYFEDTPAVYQKYQSGGYGNQPVTVKKGLAAKMIALAKETAFKPQQADAIVAAFKDYNDKNPGKR